MDIERRFESLGDFLAKANGESDCPTSSRASRSKGTDSFYHTESYEKAVDLARYGWPEGLAQVSEYFKKIKTEVMGRGKRFTPTQDIFGQEVDMGMFISGEPECALLFIEEEAPARKNINIGINCTAAYHISTEEFFRRGAATMVLLDYLEDHGYSCGITLQEYVVPSGYGSSGGHYLVEVNIKNPGEPLDLDKVTFMACNADVLRRLMFSLEETENMNLRRYFGFGQDVGGGYGCVTRVPEKFQHEIQVPELGSKEWRDFGSAENWIVEQLKEQGVEVIE